MKLNELKIRIREMQALDSGKRFQRAAGESDWRRLAGQTALRLMKAMFFWGITAILLTSAHEDVVKLLRSRETPAETAAVSHMTQNVRAEDAFGTTDSGADPVDASDATDSGAASADVSDAPDSGAVSVDVSDTADFGAASADSQERARVALTFDDGPHPVYTGRLLDGLAERGIQATFFVVGKNIPGNEELIARMSREGHLIGNHTYDHVKISDMSGPEACEQVEKTSRLVEEITGQNTEFVRPPFGAWNKAMECSFVMIPVMWDVDPLDWTTKNTALVVQRVMETAEDGDIILLHDFYESSVEAALEIADRLLEQDCEFVTVDKLILD